MAVTSGFFNSINHDRLYDAEQLSSIFDGIIIDGVYENYGKAFKVTPVADSLGSVIVDTGRAWFDHTWIYNDSQFSITLDLPEQVFNRIDAIVLNIDNRQEIRKNSIEVVKGSASQGVASKPSLINETNHHQYPIAYITRTPGTSLEKIEQENIEYVVGTPDCPIVTSFLKAQNLDNLWSQLESEFNTWWDGVKNVLDDNTVTNLQNQINEINSKIDDPSRPTGTLSKEAFDLWLSDDYGIKNPKRVTYSISEKVRYDYISPYSNGFILPDGYGLEIRDIASCNIAYGGGKINKPTSVNIKLYDTNGLGTDNIYEYSGDNSPVKAVLSNSYLRSGYSSSNESITPSATIYDVHMDSYPVSFKILLFSNDFSNATRTNSDQQYKYNYTFNVQGTATVDTVSVTSDHVISHSIKTGLGNNEKPTFIGSSNGNIERIKRGVYSTGWLQGNTSFAQDSSMTNFGIIATTGVGEFNSNGYAVFFNSFCKCTDSLVFTFKNRYNTKVLGAQVTNDLGEVAGYADKKSYREQSFVNNCLWTCKETGGAVFLGESDETTPLILRWFEITSDLDAVIHTNNDFSKSVYFTTYSRPYAFKKDIETFNLNKNEISRVYIDKSDYTHAVKTDKIHSNLLLAQSFNGEFSLVSDQRTQKYLKGNIELFVSGSSVAAVYTLNGKKVYFLSENKGLVPVNINMKDISGTPFNYIHNDDVIGVIASDGYAKLYIYD